MIKAVFFDYDGVLTTDETGSLTTSRYVSQASGIALSAVRSAFGRFNKDLTLGRTTHARIWDELCGMLGRELSIRLLYEAFESTPLNADMFSLARSLKGKYSVGIITDNKKDRIDHFKAHQDLAILFDPIVVSAEVGTDKTGTEIFRHALHCVEASPEESVFIDNNLENLAAPGAIGMKTLFHDNRKNNIQALRENLRALGVTSDHA